jgi:hypothetical protein
MASVFHWHDLSAAGNAGIVGGGVTSDCSFVDHRGAGTALATAKGGTL